MTPEANAAVKLTHWVALFVARISYDLIFDRFPDVKLVQRIRSGLRIAVTVSDFVFGIAGIVFLLNLDTRTGTDTLYAYFALVGVTIIKLLFEIWLMKRGPCPVGILTLILRLVPWMNALQLTGVSIVIQYGRQSGINGIGIAPLYEHIPTELLMLSLNLFSLLWTKQACLAVGYTHEDL